MQIVDALYGAFEIREPVLAELLHSKALDRLKRLNQYGIPDAYYHFPNYSRYEHAVGTMLLLRMLGAGVAEQIAGLLHDVTNLAFSHVADWVFGAQTTEDYQDRIRAKNLNRTDIFEIFRRYEMPLGMLNDLNSFSLLEQPAPALCADRVDYGLRDIRVLKNSFDISYHLEYLGVFDGKIVFTSVEVAESFARNFLELQQTHYASRETRIRYHLFAQALRLALEAGVITEDDFWSDDAAVSEKMLRSQNPVIQDVLLELSHKPLRNELMQRYSSVVIEKKFRYVDPLIVSNGQAMELSNISPTFVSLLKKARELHSQGGV